MERSVGVNDDEERGGDGDEDRDEDRDEDGRATDTLSSLRASAWNQGTTLTLCTSYI